MILNVDQIIDSASITEVVGDFVELKNKRGLCPFHNENTPSFHVSESRGIFKCFGCGKGGNAVSFLMELEKMSYPEALNWIAHKFKVDVKNEILTPEKEEKIKAEFDEKRQIYALNEFALTHFVENRHLIADYLQSRRINGIADRFELGYAPGGLANTLYMIDANKDILRKSGLVNAEDDGKDFFFKRLMFPIRDHRGNLAGFSGRRVDDGKEYKYLNTRDTPVFHKSDILYGLLSAKKSIAAKNCAYIVEGNIDVISLNQASIENVLAPCGTAFTDEQAMLLKKYTRNAILMFDGDDAGRKACARTGELLLRNGFNVKVISLPEGSDPDEYSLRFQ